MTTTLKDQSDAVNERLLPAYLLLYQAWVNFKTGLAEGIDLPGKIADGWLSMVKTVRQALGEEAELESNGDAEELSSHTAVTDKKIQNIKAVTQAEIDAADLATLRSNTFYNHEWQAYIDNQTEILASSTN